MKKPKKFLITGGQRMEMKSLANLTGVPEQIVTDAYVQSYMTGMRPYDILQPYVAMVEAERDGRDYTRIYWHKTDDGVVHLTMWDMNEPKDEGFMLPNMSYTYGKSITHMVIDEHGLDKV